jgi:HSP20 family protein
MKLIKRKDDWGFPSVWEDFFNNDLFNFPSVLSRGTTIPAVNISENDKVYVVELAAPGMKKDDFKISLDMNVLSISSEQSQDKVDEEKNFTMKEFSYQSFQRSFTLPESVDQNKIEASYADGVLKITLHKKAELKAKSKVIKIS